MALRPDILLNPRTPDVGRTFASALSNVRGFDALKEDRTNAPIRTRLLESQTGQAEQEQQQQRETDRITSIAQGALELQPAIRSGDVEAVRSQLLQRKTRLVESGLPTNDTDEALAMLGQEGGLDLLAQTTQGAIDVGTRLGILDATTKGQTASQRDFSTFQALSDRAAQTGDPADIEAAEQFGRQSRFDRPTLEEEAASDISKATEIERIKTSEALNTAAGKAAIAKSGQFFDQIGKIREANLNVDEAIRLLREEGAASGPIISKFPSIKSSAVQLDNVRRKMGLDVIGAVTFGALSKGELDLALDTAIPLDLEPPELIQWLENRKAAQEKLSGYYEEAATFLGTPGNTIPKWLKQQKAKKQIQDSGPGETFTSQSGVSFKVK